MNENNADEIQIVMPLQEILKGAGWKTEAECIEAWKKIIDLEYELNETKRAKAIQ